MTKNSFMTVTKRKNKADEVWRQALIKETTKPAYTTQTAKKLHEQIKKGITDELLNKIFQTQDDYDFIMLYRHARAKNKDKVFDKIAKEIKCAEGNHDRFLKLNKEIRIAYGIYSLKERKEMLKKEKGISY